MVTYRIKFLPDEKEIEVAEGSTLLQAAEAAGIFINSLCGGLGLCGSCRLQIVNGEANVNKHVIGFFSKEELRGGHVLACQTKVTNDLEVLIPPKSRLEQEQILTEGIPVLYSQPQKVSLHKRPQDPVISLSPMVTKIYLELPEPTIEDNVADIDRIIRILREKLDYQNFDIQLACLQGLATKLRDNQWKITVTIAHQNNMGRILKVEPGDTSNENYGVAIDVGTTTVVAQLVHLTTGEVFGIEASHNLQAGYGEDVISRMVYACNRGNLDPLHQAVIANINNLTQTLASEKGVDTKDINCIITSGNTTMSHFLLGLIPCSIRVEPYVPTATVYPQILAQEIGVNINPQGILQVIPSVASYMGGDIVAGILACGLTDRPEVKCLIDVGTNGEIAIGNNEWIVCCSASAGPAFEGGGLEYGMRAAKGAIKQFIINNNRIMYKTIGNDKPRGICGSGLIDIIYELTRNRIIGQDGKFQQTDNDRIVTVDDDPAFIIAHPEETETGQGIKIYQSEIGNLIKSKAAVFAAFKSLLDYVGVTFNELDSIYVAGGFGSSLDITKAIAIGLLPDIDINKIQFIGNSSVMGARMALVSAQAFEKAIDIAQKMTNIELSNYLPFMNEFIAALFIPHTNTELFPSVHFS